VWVAGGSIDDVTTWDGTDGVQAGGPIEMLVPVVVLVPAGVAGVRSGAVPDAADLPVWVDYVAALGPLIVLIGALVAAVLAWSATRRDRWWARTQWAVDHVLGDDADAQAVGLAVLEVQVRHARSAEEAGVIGAVSDTLLEPLLASAPAETGDGAVEAYVVRPPRPRASAMSEPSTTPGAGGEDVARSPARGPVGVSPVERDAARLRTRVDSRLGVPSSPTVRAIARASPH
jgi:hypothetical protein